jgi:hypothetical protein
MFNSIRNVGNNGGFLNLGSFGNNQSFGFGNMFKTTKESDVNSGEN